MPNDYLYDVFLSYKRHELVVPWVTELQKRLTFWLTQELGGRNARVFFDKDSIEVGDRWPDKIRQGLRTSRCLVAIWSPEYFQSRWCLSEWQSFLAREQQAGIGVGGLVAAIRYHDGSDWFPQQARDTQMFDLRKYRATTDAFWQTRRADELDQKLQQFAKIVARIAMRTPPFQPDWPIIDVEPKPPPPIPLREL